MSAELLCVQPLPGKLQYFSTPQAPPVAENEFAFPKSLSCCLWSNQCKYQLMFVVNEFNELKEVYVPSKNLNN